MGGSEEGLVIRQQTPLDWEEGGSQPRGPDLLPLDLAGAVEAVVVASSGHQHWVRLTLVLKGLARNFGQEKNFTNFSTIKFLPHTVGSSVISPPRFGTTSGGGLFSGLQQQSSTPSSTSSSSGGMGSSGFGMAPTFGSGPGLGTGLGGFGSPPQVGNQSAMGGRYVFCCFFSGCA